jgi:hypothetical protein
MRLWNAARAAVRARWEETPFEPDSSGDCDEEDNEDKEEGEITPSPSLHALKTSPRLVTSLASKRGSLLACARQNTPRWELGHRPSCHHRSVSF